MGFFASKVQGQRNAWRCPPCQKIYPSRAEAGACCSNLKPSRKRRTFLHTKVTKSEGKILFYLLNAKSSFARKIERVADLRQPQVSIATRRLIGRRWIKFTTVKSKGKGRPQNRYSLAMSEKDIVESIKAVDPLLAERLQGDGSWWNMNETKTVV